jgi:hypothetical protein
MMLRSSFGRPLVVAALAAAAAACASGGPKLPDQNPALVAAVQATPRVVSGESTWVSTGPGYEIVAFTRRDIADVDSSVAQESRVYAQLFGAAPPDVVVSVYRIGAPAANGREQMTFAPRPPLPAGSMAPVVDIPLIDPSARKTNAPHDDNGGYGDDRGNRGGRGGYGGGGYGGEGYGGTRGGSSTAERVATVPTDRVMRAWLSARATTITGHPPAQGSTGLVNDPRVPDWAEVMLPALDAPDTTVNRMAVALSADNVRVYPLDEFFSMQRPSPVVAGRGAADSSGGNPASMGGAGQGAGNGGGYGGGYGGRGGGMGGGFGGGGFGGGYGGGMGRGGMGGRGMRGGSPSASRAAEPLRGSALYEAQATVFGRYLMTREGAPLLGQLVDAQIATKSVDTVLAAQTAGPKSLPQLDSDWRQWLSARAESAQKH